MKAILDIPDALYRQVKAKSALEGRRIRLVAIDLFSTWINDAPKTQSKKEAKPACKMETLPPWFGVGRPYALKVKHHGMEAVRESIVNARAAL